MPRDAAKIVGGGGEKQNYAKNLLCLCSAKGITKAWVTAYLFTTWFTEYFKCTAETTLRKRDPFQNTTGH